ncbi:MAG TPA: XdhC family protein [Pantanalinema sp.]
MTTSRETLEHLIPFLRGDQPVALVTIVGSSGSIPNAVGAKMVVAADGTRLAGTVGGGEIELEALRLGAEAVATGKSKMGSYHLTEKHAHGIGMMCGGTVQLFMEVYAPPTRLVLVGAGHVNIEVARFARHLGIAVTVIDERPEWASVENYPDTEIIPYRAAEGMKRREWKAGDYLIIATADADTESLRTAIHLPCRYVGLVASKRKTVQILKNLEAEGQDLSGLKPRLRSPVGLDLGGKSPAELALSIVAEIQADRNGRDARPLSFVDRIPASKEKAAT